MVVELIVTDVKEHAQKNIAPAIKPKEYAPVDHIKVYSSLYIVPGS